MRLVPGRLVHVVDDRERATQQCVNAEGFGPRQISNITITERLTRCFWRVSMWMQICLKEW
jgi:hypothetical protein